MAAKKFSIAFENAVVAFVTYALALIAALSWNNAVQDEIQKHEGWWKRWVYAIGITVLALAIITTIMLYHDTDEDDGRTDTLRNRHTIGGMV